MTVIHRRESMLAAPALCGEPDSNNAYGLARVTCEKCLEIMEGWPKVCLAARYVRETGKHGLCWERLEPCQFEKDHPGDHRFAPELCRHGAVFCAPCMSGDSQPR